jgi:hypothetical protein
VHSQYASEYSIGPGAGAIVVGQLSSVYKFTLQLSKELRIGHQVISWFTNVYDDVARRKQKVMIDINNIFPNDVLLYLSYRILLIKAHIPKLKFSSVILIYVLIHTFALTHFLRHIRSAY